MQVLPYVGLTVYCDSTCLCTSLGVDHMSLCCIVQECVIYNGADYVVIHKPAGVQVAPTVDNLLENVLFCTAQVSQAACIMPYLEACILHVPRQRCTLSSHILLGTTEVSLSLA